MRFQEISSHHRCKRPRHEQREKYRDCHGEGEGTEEFPCDIAHEGHRDEDTTNRQGGSHHGQTDLNGRVHGGFQGFFPLSEMTDDVFHLHDGIIHQDTDHQGQGQQREDIQGIVQQMHDPEGRDDRQGQGHCRDGCRAPIAQKQPHNDDCQDRTFHQHLHGGVEGGLDIADCRTRFRKLDLRVVPG